MPNEIINPIAREWFAKVEAAMKAGRFDKGYFVLTRDHPAFPVWLDYFDNHLRWRPAFMTLAMENPRATCSLPCEWPQWWDGAFVETEGYRPKPAEPKRSGEPYVGIRTRFCRKYKIRDWTEGWNAVDVVKAAGKYGDRLPAYVDQLIEQQGGPMPNPFLIRLQKAAVARAQREREAFGLEAAE